MKYLAGWILMAVVFPLCGSQGEAKDLPPLWSSQNIASDKVMAFIEVVTKGTPQELRAALQNLPSEGVATIRSLRNHTLAHVAIGNKQHPEVLRLIAEAGVDIDHQDADGRTALHHAIDNDTVKAAEILIDLGANLFIPNSANRTPVRFCEGVLKEFPKHATCLLVVESAEHVKK